MGDNDMGRGDKAILLTAKQMMGFVEPFDTWYRSKNTGALQPNVSSEMRFGLQPVRWRVIALYCLSRLELANIELEKICESLDALLRDHETNREDWLAIRKQAEQDYAKYISEYKVIKAEIEDGR